MSRRAVMFAITDEELEKLNNCPEDERYDYISEVFEDELWDTPACLELDKAWEGIQYCLGGGLWNESNAIPTNIIFGGEFIVNTDENVITCKLKTEIRSIVKYLIKHNLTEIIEKNYTLIDQKNINQAINEDFLEYLISYGNTLLPFYENALANHLNVIFTCDF